MMEELKQKVNEVYNMLVAMEAGNLQNGIKRNPIEISSPVHGWMDTRSRKRNGIM